MRRLEWTVSGMLTIACLTLAALHLAITISTLLSSSLIHPLHDQFRLNLRYLTEPFPLNVLLLENGHRPVLPGVARFLELKWLGGWQWIQFATAWGLAAACSFVLLREIFREWPLMLFAAGSALVVMLLWWNAHARMFIHVYEAVHLFYITGGLIAAVCLVHAAAARGWSAWWHLSWLACTLAAFSFGPGIATFAALFVVALMLAAPLRVLLMIVLVTAGVLATYVWLLPGAEGVRNASGGTALSPAVFHLFARLGAPAHEIVRFFDVSIPASAAIACLAGCFVALAVASVALDIVRNRPLTTRTASLGVGLMVFGVCANALIAINRTAYFLEYPDQLFADRYLFWASIAWLGGMLWLLAKLAWAQFSVHAAAAVSAAALLVVALPSSVSLSGWSAEVYRHVERTAVGMQLEVASAQEVGAIADAGVSVAKKAVARMREEGLTGYLDATSMPTTLRPTFSRSELPIVTLHSSPDQRQFAGQLEKESARALRHEWLWLVDASGAPRGLSALTRSMSGPRNQFRLGMPTLDGIEGYWIGQPAKVAWLGVREGQALRVVARVDGTAMDHIAVK